ncbi:B-cell receptor CD22-like [Polypterus senegalus]|uniref:B-cell receptor CD22-like n=1 Tax=Polypterus senegalus TaxID=55291 RepID=UPI001962626C|nr:B-cell receptor CD22-like [Polypterus senegalus]
MNMTGLMVDTGATSHIVMDITKFKTFDDSFQAETHRVELADGTRWHGVAEHRGKESIEINTEMQEFNEYEGGKEVNAMACDFQLFHYLSDWGVEYKPKMICAFDGSTVRINCTYKHPADVTVNKKMWLFGPKENETSNNQVIAEYLKNGQGVPDSHSHRVQFLGNKNTKKCDIKISNVSREDSEYYKFRFEGTKIWTQIPGLHVTVTDAPMNTEITGHPTNCIVKGTSVTLNCRASANPPSSYTWVKENSGHVGSGEQLNIRNFNESHTGSYHCEATNILGKAKSSAVTLTVYDLSEWGATYEPMTICALEGSTVTISCKYKHPACVTIENEIWLCGPKQNETVNGEEITVYHTKESNVNRRHRQRVQFLGNKNTKTCDMKISNLSREDSGYYKFRFEGTQIWTQIPGVHVTVTGLIVEATMEEIKERDPVTLRCRTTCSLENSTISWFRNGQQLNGTSETLEIQRDDLSSYSCRTGNIRSPEFNLSTLNGMAVSLVWSAVLGVLVLTGLAVAVFIFLRRRASKTNQQHGKLKGRRKDGSLESNENCTYASLDRATVSPEYETIVRK